MSETMTWNNQAWVVVCKSETTSFWQDTKPQEDIFIKYVEKVREM